MGRVNTGGGGDHPLHTHALLEAWMAAGPPLHQTHLNVSIPVSPPDQGESLALLGHQLSLHGERSLRAEEEEQVRLGHVGLVLMGREGKKRGVGERGGYLLIQNRGKTGERRRSDFTARLEATGPIGAR